MAQGQVTDRRGVGIHLTLDPELRARIDEEAARTGLSRAALLRHLLEEALEMEEERRWLADHGCEALEEEREPWEQVKAALGL